MKIETKYTDEIKSFVMENLSIKKEKYNACFVFNSDNLKIGFTDNPKEDIEFMSVPPQEFIKIVEKYL